MTELLSELRRSPVVGDREVADLLQSLQPADDSARGRPRRWLPSSPSAAPA
jgi:hypothetical protein